jgi:capsular exopolysaccharide synthesis family protein
MRNIPRHAEPNRKVAERRAGGQSAGAPPGAAQGTAKAASQASSWSSEGSVPTARIFGRRLVVLAACLAAGLALAGGVIAALPTLYSAEARILLPPEAGDPQSAIERSPALAEQVIAELHLDHDSDFTKQPWQPPDALADARGWIEAQTGWTVPFPSRIPVPGKDIARVSLVDRFWDHVEIIHRGRTSRVMEIRAWSGDPRQAAAIANALGRLGHGSGTLIAPALPPEKSSYPPVLTILGVGAIGGVLLGLICIVLFDSKPRRFSRAEEVESASGLPVLAVVPQIEDGAAAIANVLRDPGSPYADSLRKLYEKMHSQRWTQAPKVIAVSSALPGEGRSTLAASLGRLLASEGGRVLLVDCDWRHPELHALFRLSNDTGLTSLLLDPHIALDDVIHTDALSGLDIITAGRRNRQAVHKLISEPMKTILATLATGYDLVLLDMPPVLATEQSLLLSGLVDKVVFAVRWRHTLRSRATEALDKILAARGDVLGVVLTRVDLPRYRKHPLSQANTK